jgi:hypothetical protein
VTVARERRIRRIIHNRRAGTLSLVWDDEDVETVVGGVADADRYAHHHDLGYAGMDDECNGYWGRRPPSTRAAAGGTDGT